MRTYERALLGGQSDSVPVPEGCVPSLGRWDGQRPARGAGHPGEQPPVVLRPLLRGAAAAAQGCLPGQGRVPHRARHQGPGQQGILPQRGRDPRGPGRRGGERAGAADRPAGARRGRPAGHLPRGHPDPGRPALPRQDRCGPARPGGTGAGDSLRDGEHLRTPAARKDRAEAAVPSGSAVRQAARFLPLRRHGVEPAGTPRGYRRDHVRADGTRRPGIRGHLRRGRQGGPAPDSPAPPGRGRPRRRRPRRGSPARQAS